MLHPDVEHQILLSLAEERRYGQGPVQGFRREGLSQGRLMRMMELSGELFISLGLRLKQRAQLSAPSSLPAR